MKKIINNPVLKIIYKTIKFIVFLCLAIYIAFILYQRVFNKDINGYRIYTISSNSMQPSYEKGDVILIQATSYDNLKEGDIITYKGEALNLKGLTITHRIIKLYDEKGEKRIITKGDNNDVEDPSIGEDQVIGVLRKHLKPISYVSKALNNKFIFFFLVFVPLAIVLCLEVFDFITDLKERKLEDEE